MFALLYGWLTDLLAPLIRRLLIRRARQGKEDLSRLGERFGVASHPRPTGKVIWAHAASVGESVSLLPLLDALRRHHPAAHLLVTSGTVTSANLLAARLPPHSFHQYVPVDLRRGVRQFLDHWRPDLAIIVESELWPNLIFETASLKVPVLLLNARLSDASYRGWRRFRWIAGPLFRCLSLVLTQDERQIDRWRNLGCPAVDCRGDLKGAALPLPVDMAALKGLREAIGGRPCWLAASTHPGEEAIVAATHQQLQPVLPTLLTILAPRHPKRGDEIAALLTGRGLRLARRSRGDALTPDTDFYLADTLGEMGLFYQLTPLVLVAGSLGHPGTLGGHNPLEAARLGRAILHGPDMLNCAAAAGELDRAGGALEVANAAQLTDAVGRLLRDPSALAAMGARAGAIAAKGEQIIPAYMAALAPWLDRQIGAAP